jgi:hypothetical protein
LVDELVFWAFAEHESIKAIEFRGIEGKSCKIVVSDEIHGSSLGKQLQ